jgi:mRNA export factor
MQQDGKRIAAGDTEGNINFVDLTTVGKGEVAVNTFKAHQAAVKCVRWFQTNGKDFLATGSWDKTVKYWDLTSDQPVGTVDCGERVYTMDVKNQLLVIGTAERHIHMVNLANPTTIAKTITSPLKWQTRVVSCFADASGFAVGSIEGRCAIQYVDDKDTR